MPPEGAIDEFASSWREWHYLVVGFAVGALLGWIARSLLHLRYLHRSR
jgi:hypothetical protein